MLTKRRAYLIKSVVAAALATLLGIVFVPIVWDFQTRDQPDQGSRPLIIIATQGGDKKLNMHIDSWVTTQGDFNFTFAVARPDTTSDETRAWVEYEISFVGARLDGAISCGKIEAPLGPSPIGALSVGSRHAYDVDRLVGPGSATNFGNAAEPQVGIATPAAPAASPLAEQGIEQRDAVPVYRYNGYLATYAEGEERPRRFLEVENGYGVWVGQCSIDAAALWAGYIGDAPTQSAQATFMAPQFNFTSIDETTDYQSQLYASLRIYRADGAVLAEGYPSPDTEDSSWFSWYTVTWHGKLGEANNYAFSGQPTLLFTNRDSARGDQILQLLAGLALGLGLALAIRSLSDLVDAGTRG